MRSKARHNKLILSKEIIRRLRTSELKGVAAGIQGGGSDTCTGTCPEDTCESGCPCITDQQ
jgi:hypothetical protein